MVLAERFPVPVEGMDAGGVTLGFVFAVAGILLFGWQAGLLIAAGGPTVAQLVGRRPPLRVAYNGSMFALAALAGGLAIEPISSARSAASSRGSPSARLSTTGSSTSCSSAPCSPSTPASSFFKLIARTSSRRPPPFALMASAALMLVVLWERSPALSAALVGPLLAIALYQRSTFKALRAMRLALTDPLTGLGNHRHFHERLQRELARPSDDGLTLSLCLVDIDDFKKINDRYGHPVGDRVLGQVASRLRQGGEASGSAATSSPCCFPASTSEAAIASRGRSSSASATFDVEQVGTVTVSAGVATSRARASAATS